MREHPIQQSLLKRKATAAGGHQRHPGNRYVQRVPVSPHGVGHTTGLHPDDMPYTTDAYRQRTDDENEDEMADEDVPDSWYEQRIPNSARRYALPVTQKPGQHAVVRYHRIPARSSRSAAATTTAYSESAAEDNEEEVQLPLARSRRRRAHWLLWVGLGMLVMLLLWQVALVVGTWWQNVQNDWHYGRPRTFQMDAVVGHHDSAVHPTHFIALNLNDEIQVIECPGSDCSRALIYEIVGMAATGQGENLVPVTLSVRDGNGDGKPDLLVHLGDHTFVWINTGSKVRPLQPGEHVNV